MKKLLSAILAASMLVTACAGTITASASQTESQISGAATNIEKSRGDEDFAFDGLYINEYRGSDEVIYIPETIGGQAVQGLGLNAFKSCTAREIHVPDSVQLICAWAFSGCKNLETVTLPEKVRQLQLASFENCTALKYVNLPSNMETIEMDMFKGCTSLESIHIPDGEIKSINSSGFSGCTSLKDVYIPQSLTLIGPMAFRGCKSLEEIKLADNTEFIGYWAFEDCTSLKKINIPASVTTIEEDAFRNCPDLVIYGEKDSVAEKYAHDYKIKFFDGTELYDPAQDQGDGEYDKDFNYVVNDDDTVTITGTKHIDTSVTIPAEINGHKVKSIGNAAFANIETLHSAVSDVVVSNGVSMIEDSAFENGYFLKKIQLPESIAYIGNDAFKNCNDVTIYGIPGSYAEQYANEKGINFTAIEVQDTDTGSDTDTESDTDTSVKVEEDENFEYIVNDDNTATITKNKQVNETDIFVPSVIRGHEVSGIGEGAFASDEPNTSQIKSVRIVDGLTHIDNNAFKNCTSLESIKLPSTLKTIGDDAFSNVTSMQEVVLPEGLKTIGNNNFTGMYDFFSADMPYSLKSIGDNCFKGITGSSLSVYKDSVAEQYAKDNNIASLVKMDPPKQKEIGMIGDVNGDKKVTAVDSITIQRSVIKLVKLDEKQTFLADVNRDNKVDNRDSLQILRYAIGYKNTQAGEEIEIELS